MLTRTPLNLALDVLSTDLAHLIKIVEDGGLDGYHKFRADRVHAIV